MPRFGVEQPVTMRLSEDDAPGSEVTFSLEGGKIVITPVGTSVREDRRARLEAAAARVRGSLGDEFAQLGADEIMRFIRGRMDSRPSRCSTSSSAPTRPFLT